MCNAIRKRMPNADMALIDRAVDYAAGTIEFRFPEFARVPGFTGQSGRLRFTADAVNPDVATELNNIVRITQTRVQFK